MNFSCSEFAILCASLQLAAAITILQSSTALQTFQDTGVSVRKRVIKILKDICIECPEFPKIPEICVKMIRRVNDEEGIRKLVMEVFQNMWFSPCANAARPGALDMAAAAADPLTRKVLNITDVVISSRDMGLEWFQQLLNSVSTVSRSVTEYSEASAT